MTIDYTSWYTNARAELAKVQEEKAQFQREIAARDQQIAALVQTMNAIAPLVGERAIEVPAGTEGEPPAVGMTDSIRAILKEAGEPLTASEVRERLETAGFDMKSYSNPLATIHTVLRRLTDAGELETQYEAEAGSKKFIAVSKHLAVEKIAGFELGKKGFIGVGRLRRRSKNTGGK